MPPVTIPQAFALAQGHFQSGRLRAAEEIYRQVLAVAPQNPDALNFLGIVAARTGRPELAIELMRQSISLAPRNSAYLDNLGTIFRDLGRAEEAVVCGRQALALDPHEPISHYNLANALQDLGLLTEAIASYERALALAPRDASALLGLGSACVDSGLVSSGVNACRRALALEPESATAHSALLVNLHYLEDATPEEIFAEHRRWNDIHTQPYRQDWPSHARHPESDRKLRIGYVSPDFREHPVAYFVEGVLASHDPADFEVVCYSNTERTDAVTNRLRQHAHQWRDITALSDAQAAALVRDDRIDLLVDLAGHTANHRLMVFARKPAPVQITYLGYCDTTGLEAMDYLLTDRHLDPPGASERRVKERLVRLPEVWCCYRPPHNAPDISPLPAASRGHITFASFHTLAKLGPVLLTRWAEILKRVPGSRLLFAAFGLRDPGVQSRLRDFFTGHGISGERLEFRGWQSTADYFALHQEVDILLDCHPFSGHTVCCHALWMGVPVITLAGHSRWSRMVASVLRSSGLPELVADSPDAYIRIAGALAEDLPRLSQLRTTLRERLSASSLLDAPRFTRHLEAAYREMWRMWCMP